MGATPEPAADLIARRKQDHLELAVLPGASGGDPGWGDVHLVPASLPEVSLDDLDLTTELLGHELAAPLVLVPMTGGHDDAAAVNATLGEAAARLGLAVGVGSQRAALAHPELAASFAAVRHRAPDAVVIGNLGACQLVEQDGTAPLGAAEARAAVAMVGADALSVHLNVVQELIQPEGDRRTDGLVAAIAALAAELEVPVIAKETGAGMTRPDAERLAAAGVAAIDVGGMGGTSFARIEATRADQAGDARGVRLGEVFADWGVPTAASVLEVAPVGLPVIATGGVRSGLDAAKALALGATAVGVGRIAIEAALEGTEALVARLGALLDELRTAMVLCGARTPADLRDRPPVLTGFTLEWARQRGLR